MKRERERKWYYVYGNLTEQFKQKYNYNMQSLDWLLSHSEDKNEFTTYYPFEESEFSLKQKHYTQILHTVILDFFEEIPDSLFEVIIKTTRIDNDTIELFFSVKAKQKDEEIIYANVESSAARCNERNETEVTSESAL